MIVIHSEQHAKIAVNILAEAFADAQNITWFLKPKKRNLQRFFSLLVDESVLKDGAYLTSNHRGVVLLYDMQKQLSVFTFLVRKLKLICFTLGIKKGMQLLRLQKLQASFRPKVGMYGLALAIHKDEEKWKTIFEMKKEFRQILNKTNLPVYAETTNPRYVRMYQSIGFETYHQMQHPYTQLTIWFLKLENS